MVSHRAKVKISIVQFKWRILVDLQNIGWTSLSGLIKFC